MSIRASALLVAMATCQALASAAAQEKDAELREASQAIARQPNVTANWLVRARLYAGLGKHAEAVSDYSEALARDDDQAAAYDERGNERLKLGRATDAIADFDAAIRLEPRRAAGHWQRGIALYYAERYDEGAEQFAAYQQVDDSDVENAVWRLMCQARATDLKTARQSLLKVRNDRRVPMKEIYALFSGAGNVEQVLRAAEPTPPRAEDVSAQFYAHLYVGLYLDLTGNQAEARKHLVAAVEKHRVPDYMWDIARVHLERWNKSESQ